MRDATHDPQFEPERPSEDAAGATAPPTTPGVVAPAQGAGWPTTIGVVSIVLGSLGLVGGIFAAVWTAILPRVLPSMHVPSMPRWMLTMSAVGAILGVVLAGLLLAAGIGMTRRRRWSIGAMRTWAIIKVVAAVVGTAIGWWTQSWMQQHQSASGAGAMAPMFGGVFQAGSLLIGLMWSLAWPVFCLAWLGRRASRAEYGRWA